MVCVTKASAEALFNENLKLAHYRLATRFSDFKFDDDIKQVALIGLWKAAKSFDYEKGYTFATYASRCIDNEVLMEIRRLAANNKYNGISFDEPIVGNETLALIDVIPDSFELSGFAITKADLSMALKGLSNKEKKIIWYSLAGYTQREIAEKTKLSQPYISRLIQKIRTKLN